MDSESGYTSGDLWEMIDDLRTLVRELEKRIEKLEEMHENNA